MCRQARGPIAMQSTAQSARLGAAPTAAAHRRLAGSKQCIAARPAINAGRRSAQAPATG